METSYDYVVVGAGSAGCVVAARLSEETSQEVLLVEAGGTDRLPIITMPGALPFVYQNRHIQWGHGSGPDLFDGRWNNYIHPVPLTYDRAKIGVLLQNRARNRFGLAGIRIGSLHGHEFQLRMFL